VPENYFVEATTQPYVHDCMVTVHDDKQLHRFKVYFKWHVYLALNPAIPSKGRSSFRGDVMVMRVGTNGAVVNLRAGDTSLADYVVRE
jgi:hypothetical protein